MKKLSKGARTDLLTYAGVIIAFIIVSVLKANGLL